MICVHENTGLTEDGQRTYCTDCGQRMYTPRDSALADGRRVYWQKVEGSAGYIVHRGEVYIGASFNPSSDIWVMQRVVWCEDCAQWELAQSDRTEITSDHIRANPQYVAPDLLGVPNDPARRGLSSAAA